MIRRLALLLLGLLGVAVAAAAWFRVDLALRVVPNFAAREICTQEFVARRNAGRAFDEIVKPTPGVSRLAPMLRWTTDDKDHEIRASLAGFFAARAAFRAGYGCLLDHGEPIPPPLPMSSRETPDEPPPVAPAAGSPLAVALDHVFARLPDGRDRGTQAVVILKDGRIVAERYVDGGAPTTLMSGFSVTKSVVNALVGVLVADGALDPKAPAPVAQWSAPDDLRRAITIEQLLRMTSGLDLDETNSGFDANSHMLYLESDMAAFSARAPLLAAPGARWAYSSSGIMLLAGILHEKIGGPEALRRFAQERLFAPAGMRRTALEFDAAGNFIGSTYMAATARDWARFGQLFLDEGRVGGKRILPAGWADFSASPTPGAAPGYGAGFWTNRGESAGAQARVNMGFPADSYFASGSMGQRIVIVPSERLVVARFGRTALWPDFDIAGTARLVRETIQALKAP